MTTVGKMGFLDHLEELRGRLIRSCLAIGAGMIVAFVFANGSRRWCWTDAECPAAGHVAGGNQDR